MQKVVLCVFFVFAHFLCNIIEMAFLKRCSKFFSKNHMLYKELTACVFENTKTLEMLVCVQEILWYFVHIMTQHPPQQGY